MDFSGDNLRNDSEFAKRMFTRASILKVFGGLSILSFTEDVRSNRDVVKAAVRYNSLELGFVVDKFKDDREIVEAALNSHAPKSHFAFKFASERLRSDTDMVKYAVEKDVLCFQFASEKARNELKIAEFAVEKDYKMAEYAGKKLKNGIVLLECLIVNYHWNEQILVDLARWGYFNHEDNALLLHNTNRRIFNLYVSEDVKIKVSKYVDLQLMGYRQSFNPSNHK